MLCTNLFTSLLVSISPLPILIHPPDTCGISWSWLNGMILTQMHLVLGTIKGPSKMCSFCHTTQCHRCLKFWGSTQLACWLQECPRYLRPTDAYLYSHSCEIHRLGRNAFISSDWFPYMNCNSVKSFKLLHVAFIFLFSINWEPCVDK